MNKILTTIILGLVVCIVWAGITFIINKAQDDVIVEPNQIQLTTKDWDKTAVFELKNKSPDQTYFSVWVKIRDKKRKLDFADIEITTDKGDSFISEHIGDVSVNYDLVELKGYDAKKRPCIYLLLYRLNSSQSKFFKIKSQNSPKGKKKSYELLLEVKGFSKSSAPIVSKDGKAALAIKPPESFDLKSLCLLMGKSQID